MKTKMKWIGLVAWGILTVSLGVMLAESGAKVTRLTRELEQAEKVQGLWKKMAATAKDEHLRSEKKWEAKLDELSDKVRVEMDTTAELEKANARLMAYAKAYEELRVYAERLGGAAVDNSPARTPNSVYQRSAASEPAPSLVTGKAKVAPLWQLPIRSRAAEAATKRAQAKWGNDFSQVKYSIDREMDAYAKLEQYHKQAWKPLMRTLLNEAGQEWPNDFTMMVYELEKQIEAKDKLDGKR